MSRTRLNVCVAALTLNAVAVSYADAQSIAPASYDRVANVAADAPTVQFSRRAPQVGDQLQQVLSVGLNLNTMVRQDQQVLEKSKTSIRREQTRVVTATHVHDGVTMAVSVRYAAATRELATGPADGEFGDPQRKPQPVEGKVYRVARDGEALVITAEDGSVPPLDEYEIIALNMESLGRPNPLADFLAGKTLAIGQQISLPAEVAEKLMGLGGELGEVTRFDLTLKSVATVGERKCAVFQSNIEAVSNDSSQMRLAVEGPLAIEIDTCRTVDATFAGPIGMSETRGSLSATYQLTGTGRMSIHIATKYADLAR
jgi:hypothetical protein